MRRAEISALRKNRVWEINRERMILVYKCTSTFTYKDIKLYTLYYGYMPTTEVYYIMSTHFVKTYLYY